MSRFEQIDMFDHTEIAIETKVTERPSIDLLPLNEYDHIIISLSGGKDSVACTLKKLDEGVPAEKIELWHPYLFPVAREWHIWRAHEKRLTDW